MSQIEVTGEKSVFETLSKVDVSEYVKEISNRKYLPWADAWNILKSYYPLTTTETTKFLNAEGTDQPYMKTDTGYYVEISVTVEGETGTEVYPVMEPARGKGYVAIAEPNAVQVNKAIKRGLVKAIAILTGLGLYLWLGEDLPVDVSPGEDLPEPANMLAKPEPAMLPKPEVMLSDNQRELIDTALTFEGKTISDTVKKYLMETRGSDDLLELLKKDPPGVTKVLADRILKQWEDKDGK